MDDKTQKAVDDLIKLSEALGINLRNSAALNATLNGDIENALVASTPGGIEAQEKRGQDSLVKSDLLPINTNDTDAIFEKMGIVFGEAVDDLFRRAKLPEGWQKVPTEQQMWSKLLDNKNRQRAIIFYKAAFYDRGAHMSADRRYTYRVTPDCGERNYEKENESCWHAKVFDYDGSVVWTSETKVDPKPSREDNQAVTDWYDAKDRLGNEGLAWLDANYPNWKDAYEYWD